jgi:hypothetical protein
MNHRLTGPAVALLGRAAVLAVVLIVAGCKGKAPPEPASPPKPKMEQSATQPFSMPTSEARVAAS